MANTALNRTVVSLLTNKSGGNLNYGDVVIIDTANAKAFTTTTSAGYSTTGVGVIIEPNGIASNATGLVATGGWVPKVTLNTAATIGQFLKTHTVAGQATPHSTQAAGDFGYALQASSTPEAILWGGPNPSVSGTGTVTHTGGALTSGQLLVGAGADDIAVGDLSGDVSTSGSAVTTIGNAKVSLAKIANASANSKLLGSGATGAGSSYAELTLGTNLSMSGTTLNAAGGGGTGTMPPIVFRPAQNEPPSSAFATLDTRNGHPTLDFDGSTDEEAVFTGVLPAAYASGGLTVSTFWAFTSATSGSLRVQAAIERMDTSSLDTDSDSFAAFQSAGGTAPATSGQVIKVDVAFTDGAQMDSLAAGEMFRLKIHRDADGTSGTDDITTDAELLAVQVTET